MLVVAALGTPVAVNLTGIGGCFGPLSVEYTHPPASQCLSFTSGDFLAQQIAYSAVEAVLASIFLIPAAHYAGARLSRHHTGRNSQPGASGSCGCLRSVRRFSR